MEHDSLNYRINFDTIRTICELADEEIEFISKDKFRYWDCIISKVGNKWVAVDLYDDDYDEDVEDSGLIGKFDESESIENIIRRIMKYLEKK